MKINDMLSVRIINHDELGEILEIHASEGSAGAPFWVELGYDRNRMWFEKEMGLRLTKKTAKKLAITLLKLLSEEKDVSEDSTCMR